jgi:crotonobetainyl-CoA:carnitine CoA-transferase CaiB-like acyl-CoA transferase
VSLCRAIGRDDLPADLRFSDFARRADHLPALAPLVQAPLLERSTDEWIQILTRHDVLCNRVHGISDWLDDPHVRATHGYATARVEDVGEFPVVAIPGDAALAGDRPAHQWPEVGEHWQPVLERFGFTRDEIDGLCAAGALVRPQQG